MDEKERELKFRKEIAVAIKQERRYFGYSTKTVSAFLKMDWRKYSRIERAEEPKSLTTEFMEEQLKQAGEEEKNEQARGD